MTILELPQAFPRHLSTTRSSLFGLYTIIKSPKGELKRYRVPGSSIFLRIRNSLFVIRMPSSLSGECHVGNADYEIVLNGERYTEHYILAYAQGWVPHNKVSSHLRRFAQIVTYWGGHRTVQLLFGRKLLCEIVSSTSLRRVDKVIAPRRPTERAR